MEVKRGYKQTEVGVIPEDWEVVNYAAVGQIIDGDRGTHYPSAGELLESGYCLFLNAGNVTKDGFRFADCQFVSQEKDGKLSKGKLARGDVVLTTRGTIGNFAYFDEDVPYEQIRINSGMVILRNISPAFSRRYHYLILRSQIVESQLERLSFGSAQPQLTVGGISTLAFPLPPTTDEQEAIAEALSDADALIESLEQLLTKKRQIKQGAMQELLTGKKRLAGFKDVWGTRTLEQISAFITKGSTPTTYGFGWTDSGVMFLRSECVSERGLDLGESMFISSGAHTLLRRSEVRAGDILMTITGNVGRVIMLGPEFPEANINQHIARIRISARDVDPWFVFHMLTPPSVRNRYNSITTGQAYPQISLAQVRSTEISVPSLSEQTAIAAVLTDMDAAIATAETKLIKARQLKQGMMQELLTGRTRLV